MGKNKHTTKAAWRAAAAATAMLSTASPSPAHSLKMHAPAPDIGELPACAPQQPCKSQMVPAVATRHVQSPAPSLVIEPATPVADAMPAFAVKDTTHMQDRHAPNTCATTREHEPPPVLAPTTNAPHETPHASPSLLMQPSLLTVLSMPPT
ncbi:hypothetical protein EWM64_g10248, partial [Hericium alpestre]